MTEQSNTKRIAKNTLMLYFRQILIMAVSLFTVRVVLNVLGAEDYGIYNVVAGVVTMFSFLSSAMSAASQRYFSYDLGRQDLDKLNETFSITVIVYFFLTLILVVIAETVGLWFLFHKLVIPANRFKASVFVFQFSVLSFVFTLMTTPFLSLLMSHEKMDIYAFVSLIEVSLKLILVFVLKYVLMDRLILYSVLMFLVTFINTSIYRFICKKNFPECKFKLVWEKDVFRNMISYVGWNLFGSFSNVVRNQGINILLNLFFGPIVNAARSISFQVSSALLSFATNFTNAIRPQIIKSYAANNKDYMLILLEKGTKIVFFLMLYISIPLYLEAPYILSIWLTSIPDKTTLFVRLLIIDVLIDCITYPLMTVSQATGKIKKYQIVVGTSLILILPISYVFLKFGYGAEWVFIVSIFISIIALFLRIYLVQEVLGINLFKLFICMIVKFLCVTILSYVIPFLYTCKVMHSSITSLLLCIVISIVNTSIVIFIFGINKNERKFLLDKLKLYLRIGSK